MATTRQNFPAGAGDAGKGFIYDFGTDRMVLVGGRTVFSNANYTAVATDRVIAQTGALSAARVVTLPAANAVPGGTVLQLVDESGTATATFTLSWTRAGSDTINGATGNVVAVNSAYGSGAIESNGATKWTTLGATDILAVHKDDLFINVKDPAYGAKGDVRTVTDAVVSGQPTTTVTSATAAFTSADVGKLVTLNGAGASGAVLATTVATVVNATTITVANSATTNVSAALLAWGTDDSTAIQAAIDAASAVRGVAYFPPGIYGRGASTVTSKLNVIIRGAGMDVSTIYALRTGVRLLEEPNLGGPVGSFQGIEDITLWGFRDRTSLQGGDADRLACLRAERVWLRRVHGINSRQMSFGIVGTLEARAENCVVEKSLRDGINPTGSGRFIGTGNSFSEIYDDAVAFHIQQGLTAGTVVSPQAVIVGNRFEKCFGVKCLGATSCVITGNSGQFLTGYGVFVGYDTASGEGLKDSLAVNISNNVFRDIIDFALLGGGVVCRGIWVAPMPPAQGSLGYWPGLAGPGTGTVPVLGPTNGAGDQVSLSGKHTGSYGIVLAGNTIMQTLEGLTKFSDSGFGQLWGVAGPADPNMTGTVFRTGGNTSVGVTLAEGALRDVLCQLNTIEGVRYGFYMENFPVQPVAAFRNNKIYRVHHAFTFISGGTDKYGQFLIEGNEIDIDPLFEAAEREKVSGQFNGHWAWTSAGSALIAYTNQVHGVYMTRNTFRNTLGVYSGSSDAVAVWDNTIFADTATGGVAFGDPGGVSFDDAMAANNRIVQYVSDPRLATYGQIRDPGFDTSATAMPTTGTYAKNTMVRNRTPTVSAGKVTLGWLRLTNGTGHVSGTDWAPVVVTTS